MHSNLLQLRLLVHGRACQTLPLIKLLIRPLWSGIFDLRGPMVLQVLKHMLITLVTLLPREMSGSTEMLLAGEIFLEEPMDTLHFFTNSVMPLDSNILLKALTIVPQHCLAI